MYEVVIVGTGFGGISAALTSRKQQISNFAMLERRSFVGGTWLQNRYPGAAVDVQSPLYSLSGHPYPWSHLFAKQAEIADYTTRLFNQHDLNKHVKLNANVKEALWQQDHWQIRLHSNEIIKTKVLINATGPLSTPVVPKFKNLDLFNGKAFHCNDWPKALLDDSAFENKTVAVIGSGASAVQIIPAIINKVKHLHVFQRTPHWILPRLDWSIPTSLKNILAFKPIYNVIRFFIYWSLELRVIAFKYSKRLLKLVGERPAKAHLKKQIRDDDFREKLTPDFIIGCKRILISNTYYPAIQASNCTFHDKSDAILEFLEDGLKTTNNEKITADIVVFATGYNAQESMVSYPVIGNKGVKLHEQWHDYPRAYLGTSVPNFPNFFVVTGPNTGIGHTSAIFVIESQMKYIAKCLEVIKSKHLVSLEPTEIAEENYTQLIHKEMQRTVWSYGGCTSWYQNAQGKVIAMFPGFSFVFRRLCKRFNFKHHILNR